ncbi:MAG: WG repeat-containing protein [Clostridia bacterium]|nr:WG repeat-containing protein [Clostridia bacterium]
MSRGKRYNGDRKLNMKKVFAVIMAIVIIILFIMVIAKLLQGDGKTSDKSFVSAYYAIYEDGKWGVIDTKGNVIINQAYSEMIVIPDNSKDVFLCVENVDYTNNTYTSKAIDKKGNKLYTNYEKVEAIYNNDENNTLIYEQNTLKVQKDGKYGLINLDGREILACDYDEINVITGTKGAFITVKDGKLGLVDTVGNIIIENEYLEIKALTNKYENGFIVKGENGKYGVVKYNKSVALETKYDEIKSIYGNSMYVVKEGNSWKVLNEEGQTILENGFTDVKFINADNIIYVKDGKYGVTNHLGQELIGNEYEEITYAYSGMFIAKKDGKYGMINSDNEEKLPFEYSNITYVSDANFIQAQKEGLESELLNRDLEVKAKGIISEINVEAKYIKVRENNEYKYYNFKLENKANTEILIGKTLYLSKKDGKYGYVNEKGIVVVDYIYDDATEQNNYGYVAVKKDGKWGCLNQKGKVEVEPTYELENNLVIDFISKWHLAEDLNANYYTK